MTELNTKPEYIDRLIVKYHLKTASQEQKQELLLWLKESEENKGHFQKVSEIWHSITEKGQREKIDAKEQFELFAQDKFNTKNTKDQQRNKLRILYTTAKWAAAAAILILVIFAGNSLTSKNVNLIAADETLKEILPDGSVVTLNKNSVLNYRYSAFSSNRNVTMKGDVYFEVEKDKKPFVITTSGVQIAVVGTSFHVNNTAVGVSVFVEEGTVDVSFIEKNSTAETERLTAGKSIIANTKTSTLVKNTSFDYNTISWKTGQLVFKNKKLSDVIKTLEELHDVTISAENEDNYTRELTANFADSTELDVMIQIIELSLNVSLNVVENSKN